MFFFVIFMNSNSRETEIFTALADGLQWVLQRWGTSFIAHYLDDFITLGPANVQRTSISYMKQEKLDKLSSPNTSYFLFHFEGFGLGSAGTSFNDVIGF